MKTHVCMWLNDSILGGSVFCMWVVWLKKNIILLWFGENYMSWWSFEWKRGYEDWDMRIDTGRLFIYGRKCLCLHMYGATNHNIGPVVYKKGFVSCIHFNFNSAISIVMSILSAVVLASSISNWHNEKTCLTIFEDILDSSQWVKPKLLPPPPQQKRKRKKKSNQSYCTAFYLVWYIYTSIDGYERSVKDCPLQVL